MIIFKLPKIMRLPSADASKTDPVYVHVIRLPKECRAHANNGYVLLQVRVRIVQASWRGVTGARENLCMTP